MARLYYKHIMLFSLGVWIIQTFVLWYYSNAIIDLFTSDERIKSLGHSIFWIVQLEMSMDFWQGVLGGIVRALGQQGIFTPINIFSYYCIAFPLVYFFGFYVGEHEHISEDSTIGTV